ncbi:sulfurtransferase [Chryseomicrobium excrementi]|uniref:Sulfurtransferase n=1 Tax=Chryseomicrobium excrementi TaxID=2041346 RepID=A0A2M9F2P1_9BACL|nr:rhodanese-like domain-containing protein [Chryseomicrobium excrementi]PJK17732.1 sulfurtransferase [Chryseomicrobium excrementi]
MIITKDVHELPKRNTRFIDTRFDLQNPKWGEYEFQQEHIAGAVYWHLEEHLSDMSKVEGRHPAPSEEQMTRLIQTSGLQYDDQVILYDQGNAPFAARAALLLLWAGFPHVSIAREGYSRLKEVYPLEGGTPWYPKTDQQLTFNKELLVTEQDVKNHLATGGAVLDARSSERFKGNVEPIDPIAGHIPGAQNLDWESLKTEHGLMKSSETTGLFQQFSKEEPVITYCGSGVTASPLTIALLEAGFENVHLYAGSYSDWIRNNAVETSK